MLGGQRQSGPMQPQRAGFSHIPAEGHETGKSTASTPNNTAVQSLVLEKNDIHSSRGVTKVLAEAPEVF